MTLSLHQWHKRYQQQSRWTKNLRDYIFKQIDMSKSNSVLEVGSGTGVLLEELAGFRLNNLVGIDIDLNALSYSQDVYPHSQVVCADAFHLPFSSNSFDVVYCHFLLLWIEKPLKVITEMVRVSMPGGYILALAEPDYGGIIDYPQTLSRIGRWQAESLVEQGADPKVGRSLRSLFSQVNLCGIEVGLLGGQWKEEEDQTDFELEWDVIVSDLNDNQAFKDEAVELKRLEKEARRVCNRIRYIPTFYALGRVK